MAKKQYDSPQMRVRMLQVEDVITASLTYYEGERTTVGSFKQDWLNLFD